MLIQRKVSVHTKSARWIWYLKHQFLMSDRSAQKKWNIHTRCSRNHALQRLLLCMIQHHCACPVLCANDELVWWWTHLASALKRCSLPEAVDRGHAHICGYG